MGAYSNRVIADGASYYWRLGEPSGTTAVDAVGGANGTISGGVTLNQPGALSDGNRAMTFDGVDGTALTAVNVSLPVSVTIEAWINIPVAADGNYHSIFSTNTGNLLFAIRASHFLRCYSGSATPTVVGGLTQLAVNQWHHVVMVHTGALCTFYVNGVVDTAVAQSRTLVLAPGAIGRDPIGGNPWNGSIDEVAIYPRALTAPGIAAHYLAGKQSVSWPGVPWWVQIHGGDILDSFNVWEPITTSDTVNLPRGVSGGIWVGSGGDVAAVMSNNVMPVVLAAVPTGAWLPLAAKRINATGTTATGLVALYEV